jgi:hypothetical protein
MTEDQRVAAVEILRNAGYTSAWIFTDTDVTETGFLVPEADLDWVAPYESPLMSATCISLMHVFPRSKVFIGPYRRGLPLRQLY